MKKIVPLVLALSMCVALLSGCQSSELKAYSDDTTASGETTQKDYTPCFESYEPDEVMMTIDGIDVTWRELFYWYYYDVSNLESYYGEITDWDAASPADSEQSYREYVVSSALDVVKHYCALEKKAADMGITLSDADKAEIQSRWDTNVQTYGSGDESAFVEYLEGLFLSKDLYNHINEVSTLYTLMKTEMYGANGEKLSADEVLDKAEEMGYMRAKHIFLSTTDDSGNALSDEDKTAKKAQLQTMLDELKKITEPAKLEARLDELAKQSSEDTGLQYYTEGYTFTEGDMDEKFDAAVAATEVNALYPEIVESSMGYHIVMRLPLSTTAAVEYTSEDAFYSLPYYVAEEMFASLTDSWAEESEVELTKTYKKMDIAKVFKKATVKASATNSGNASSSTGSAGTASPAPSSETSGSTN